MIRHECVKQSIICAFYFLARKSALSVSRSLSTQFTDSFAQTESNESGDTNAAPKIVEKDMVDSGVVDKSDSGDKSERISPSGSVSTSFVGRLRYASVGEDEAIIVDNVPSSQEVFVS